jgi:hypothetical protein
MPACPSRRPSSSLKTLLGAPKLRWLLICTGATLAQVATLYAVLPSARLAFSGVDFQETMGNRLHGNDHEMLRTLKERFVEAQRSLRDHVWPSDVGKRLAEVLAS